MWTMDWPDTTAKSISNLPGKSKDMGATGSMKINEAVTIKTKSRLCKAIVVNLRDKSTSGKGETGGIGRSQKR